VHIVCCLCIVCCIFLINFLYVFCTGISKEHLFGDIFEPDAAGNLVQIQEERIIKIKNKIAIENEGKGKNDLGAFRSYARNYRWGKTLRAQDEGAPILSKKVNKSEYSEVLPKYLSSTF
jgi:hypothetical protein